MKIMLSGDLGKGKYALVDDEDFARLNQLKWFWGKQGYARRTSGKKDQIKGLPTSLLLHYLIIKPQKGYFTDHKDGNKLNNQRYNLRRCTKSQNNTNRGKQKNNKSGYKGVSRNKGFKNPWVSFITNKNKSLYLGCYETKEQAAQAYNEAAKKYYGDFAYLNFIQT